MEKLDKKKICLIVLAAVIVLAAYWYYSSTQWERDFEIRYVEYVGKSQKGNYSGKSYYLYEITNKTNHTLTDVYAVISVEDLMDEFEYEDLIEYNIKAGETVEYRIYTEDYEEAAEAQGETLVFVSSVEIVKIKYSK